MYLNVHKAYYESLPFTTSEIETLSLGGKPMHYFIDVPDSDRIWTSKPHNHEALEIMQIIEGTITVVIQGTEYTLEAGDICILNSCVEHGMFYSRKKPFICWRVYQLELSFFSPSGRSSSVDIFNDLINQRGSFESIIPASSAHSGALCGMLDNLYYIYNDCEQNAANDCSLLGGIYTLLGYLINHSYISHQPAGHRRTKSMRFIDLIDHYLEVNYTKPLTTAHVAEALSYSKTHFCRLFQENFGNTFSNYLCEYRVKKAVMDYRASCLSLKEIAVAVGFENYRYFARCFVKYIGHTPSAYFKGRRHEAQA